MHTMYKHIQNELPLNNNTLTKMKRIVFLDYVRVFACLLVMQTYRIFRLCTRFCMSTCHDSAR